jgi:membrane associated rhomboid family serine protease
MRIKNMSDDTPNNNVISFRSKNESSSPNKPPPMLDIPPASKILCGLLLFVHVALWALSETIMPYAKDMAISIGGFVPARWTGELPFTWWTPLSSILFSFLHVDWMHIGVNLVMLVAIGSGLEKNTNSRTFLLVYILSTLFSVAAHFALSPFSTMPIIGASGGVNGLFGAALYMMRPADSHEENSIIPRSMIPVVLVWVGLTVLTGLMGSPNGSPVAWIAHIGGFFAGLGIMIHLSRKQSRKQ